MKKSIKAIAAAAAALTLAFSCVPMAYAVGEVPAAQTETETAKKTGVTFKENKSFAVPYSGSVCMTADDGTVYYEGRDTAAECVYYFSLDENGEVDRSYKVSRRTNDKGKKLGIMNSRLKQCGEYFYLIYSECYGFSMRETVIIKLDSELNEVARYHAVFKIYRDNKLLDTYSISVKGFCKFAANNGVITVSYSGRESDYSGWVSIDFDMSDAEYEEYLASRPKTEYPMKAMTISYSVNE